MDLIAHRNKLDTAIPLLPHGSADRERLWHDLEGVVATLTDAIDTLASLPSEGYADLDRKATVLMAILRRYITEAITPGPEILALSLSLAEDVHRLASAVGNGIDTA